MTLNLADFAAKMAARRQPNQELSAELRAAICTLIATGRTQRKVGALFRVSKKAVQGAVQHFKTDGSFCSKPCSGRPEVLTRREKRYILTLIKRNRKLAKKALLHITGTPVSYSTIRRCLRHHNIRKWKAMKRIPLSKEVAMDRYNFVCDQLDNLEEFLQVCSLKSDLVLAISNFRRPCSQTSVHAKIVLQIRLPGYSVSLLRSSTLDSSTSGTM
jgi:transposase